MIARNTVLGNLIESREKKVANLQEALKNAAELFDENDKRTKSLATQLKEKSELT